MDLNALRYAKSHEWARADGDLVVVGITQYAVDQLTDVTHLQLPKVGAKTTAGKPFGEIESVKAVSDIYSPVTGEVIEANAELPDALDTLGSDPWKAGWMIKVRVQGGESPDLMDARTYEKHLESEA